MWNPSHHSTPLDQRRPTFKHDLSLSVIPETPASQPQRILSPLKRAADNALQSPLNPPDIYLSSRGRSISPARETFVQPPILPESKGGALSILSPRSDDEYDRLQSSPSLLAALQTEERPDLAHSSGYLDECIKKDLSKIDIADQLLSSSSAAQAISSSGSHPDDYASVDVSHFRIAVEYPVADSIVLATQESQSGYTAVGCFAELRVSYAFVDTKLFLWHWENHNEITTVAFSEYVTAVGLLNTTLPGFAHFGCNCALVVATSTEILFVAVSKVGDHFSVQTENFLLRTSTNEQRFCRIQTTRAGRVFLGSTEGYLFELQNIQQTLFTRWLWLSPKLVNCSLAVYERIVQSVPGLNLLFRKECITYLVMDETRKILYTLRKDNNIDLYDLGADGTAGARHLRLPFSEVVSQAMPLLRNVDRLQVKQIVSIHPVPIWESSRYSFFILTSAGLRLYFGTSYIPKPDGMDRPSTFILGHVRFPPGHNPSGPLSNITAHMNVTDSMYFAGTLMMVHTDETKDSDGIVSANHDLYIYEEKFQESVSACNIPYRIEAMMELPVRTTDSLLLKVQSPAINQVVMTRKLIVVMTLKKCYILEKSYAVDILEKLLRNHSPMSPQVRQFVEWLPPVHSCFLALDLACSTSNPELAKLATRVLRVYGGEPKVTQELLQGRNQNTSMPQSPISVVQYSPKHDAVYHLVSRIVAPFWNSKAFVFAAEYKGAVAWISGMPSEDIAVLVDQLTLVKNYLDVAAVDLFYPGRTISRHGMPNEAAVLTLNALKAEMVSIRSLTFLLDCIIQLLKLWQLLLQEGFAQIMDYLNKAFTKTELAAINFSDLLVTPHGRGVLESLIKAVHQRYIDDGADAETVMKVTARLQDICPRLFDNDDAITMRVLTMIDKAKSAPDKTSSTAMLEQALTYVRPNANIMGMNEILDRLTEGLFLEAAVELCMEAANQSDPQNFAHRYLVANEPPADVQGKGAMERRQKYYGYVTKILGDLEAVASGGQRDVRRKMLRPSEARMKLEQILEMIFAKSSDVLLHFSLFEWCFACGLDRYALSSKSPFLKDYLVRKLTALGSAEMDAAARFLRILAGVSEKENDKWTASTALFRLASLENSQTPIAERLEALSKAGILCQSLDQTANEGVLEFLRLLHSYFTLASIQRDIFLYIEEKCLDVRVSQDLYQRVAFDLLDAKTLLAVADELHAYHWTLAIMGVFGEPPRPKLIIHLWGKFLQKVLDYSATRHLSREASIAIVVEQIIRVRSHLSPASQYCALDLIVEGFESRYATYTEKAMADPSYVFDCVLEGLGQNVVDIVDVYHKLLARYASEPVLSPHLLRVHAFILNSLLDDRFRKYANKDQRRVALTSYVRTFDNYLRAAMKLHLADEELLGELQTVSHRLANSDVSRT